MASVEVKGLKKSFGKIQALKGVSFKVDDGELFCLLAPPGAGKTTLLRIIAGLELPDEGEIFFDDVLVNSIPPQMRDVAMIFEAPALYPHLTGFDNIAYPLRLRKLARKEIVAKVTQVAEMLHITHILNRRPATFSGGESRRVAIARALVRRPRVLLLDQPFSDLDAKIRQEMAAELKRLKSEVNQTMILATHDYEEAMIADRIAVMHKGETHQIASPKDVYDIPATTFVAQFVGSPAMNLFPCVLERVSSGTIIRHNAFSLLFPVEPSPFKPEIYLGIRPERIKLDENGIVRAKVEVMQILGEETIVDLTLADGSRFKWVGPTALISSLRRGEEVKLTFPFESLHFFDKETGERLLLKR